jgi:predicted cupin superfamily sugar epimerase
MFSALHSLTTDEVFHFYYGDPVEMLLLDPQGSAERVILGQDLLAGQRVQFVVPRGVWQGSRILPGGEVALMGTTMAPGYEPSDFVLGDRQNLSQAFPEYADLIAKLTRVQ